jgi:hypothetical protein
MFLFHTEVFSCLIHIFIVATFLTLQYDRRLRVMSFGMSHNVNRKIVLDVLKDHVPSSESSSQLFHPDNEGNTVVRTLNVTQGEVLSTLGQLYISHRVMSSTCLLQFLLYWILVCQIALNHIIKNYVRVQTKFPTSYLITMLTLNASEFSRHKKFLVPCC